MFSRAKFGKSRKGMILWRSIQTAIFLIASTASCCPHGRNPAEVRANPEPLKDLPKDLRGTPKRLT
jgi:hypothetical protein